MNEQLNLLNMTDKRMYSRSLGANEKNILLSLTANVYHGLNEINTDNYTTNKSINVKLLINNLILLLDTIKKFLLNKKDLNINVALNLSPSYQIASLLWHCINFVINNYNTESDIKLITIPIVLLIGTKTEISINHILQETALEQLVQDFLLGDKHKNHIYDTDSIIEIKVLPELFELNNLTPSDLYHLINNTNSNNRNHTTNSVASDTTALTQLQNIHIPLSATNIKASHEIIISRNLIILLKVKSSINNNTDYLNSNDECLQSIIDNDEFKSLNSFEQYLLTSFIKFYQSLAITNYEDYNKYHLNIMPFITTNSVQMNRAKNNLMQQIHKDLIINNGSSDNLVLFAIPFNPVYLSEAFILSQMYRKDIAISVSISNTIAKIKKELLIPYVELSNDAMNIKIRIFKIKHDILNKTDKELVDTLNWQLHYLDNFNLITNTIITLLKDINIEFDYKSV